MTKEHREPSDEISQPIFSDDVGLYIHIPFCAQRCHFCAFYLVIQDEQRVTQFLVDLKKEITLWASQGNTILQNISTVYIGGGTPTVLSATQLDEILCCLSAHWSLDPQIEITVESTPESVTAEKITDLKKAGVTRFSMGVQSFDAGEREKLGLQAGVQPVQTAVRAAQAAGLDNINLDLIYGIPGQTASSWNDNLAQTLALQPRHLSCYALSMEEGTRFFRQWQQGTLRTCDSEEEQVFQELADEQASKAGLTRYEISNWAYSGYACRHNRRYWQGQDYLGLGPSAQSYVGGFRWGNAHDLLRYSKRLGEGQLPVQNVERLEVTRQRKERVVFGLRQVDGIPTKWVHDLEHDLEWSRALAQLLSDHLVTQIGDRYRLTRKGQQFADTVGQALW